MHPLDRRILAAGTAALLLPLLAAAAAAQPSSPSTVIRGGVTTTRHLDYCGHMDPHDHPNEDPKTTRPFCAYMQSSYKCDVPPHWAYPGDWKILEREGGLCLVAAPLVPQDRARLANRTIETLKQVQASGVYRVCETSPWDPEKLMCEKPPWTPPQRGNVDANGGCPDGSNGGGRDSTNYYGCPGGTPSGPYIRRLPPTGPSGPNQYPPNRVICQNILLTPEQWAEMNKSPYVCPPEAPRPPDDGSNPYTYTPPRIPGEAPLPPPKAVKVIKSGPRGTEWDWTCDNGTRWTAPRAKQVRSILDGRLYTYYLAPETFRWVRISGRMGQAKVAYSARIGNTTDWKLGLPEGLP